MVNKLVQLYPMGSAIAKLRTRMSQVEGRTVVSFYVRDGDTWKRCMTYVNNKVTLH